MHTPVLMAFLMSWLDDRGVKEAFRKSLSSGKARTSMPEGMA